MAHVEQACRSTKYHSHSAAAQMSGAQPRRECLAVHARQLAVEPCIQILYRYPRSLLLRMEQPHRSAMAHHVTRSARLGAPVSIIESWYESAENHLRRAAYAASIERVRRWTKIKGNHQAL